VIFDDLCDFRDIMTWRLILLFNKIRFENNINIEMWGRFKILDSFGEKE